MRAEGSWRRHKRLRKRSWMRSSRLRETAAGTGQNQKLRFCAMCNTTLEGSRYCPAGRSRSSSNRPSQYLPTYQATTYLLPSFSPPFKLIINSLINSPKIKKKFIEYFGLHQTPDFQGSHLFIYLVSLFIYFSQLQSTKQNKSQIKNLSLAIKVLGAQNNLFWAQV